MAHKRLAQNDAHVSWLTIPDEAGGPLETDIAILSDDERTRCARFRVDRDARAFAAAHTLLRRTLSAFADVTPEAWRFTVADAAKPALAPEFARCDLAFNLTHTDGLVACIVASAHAQPGIDAERTQRPVDWRDIAAHSFATDEVKALDALGDDDGRKQFFELWTLKEAFAKAIGLGLLHPLDQTRFDFALHGAMTCMVPKAYAHGSWYLASYAPTAEHVLAVALSDGAPRTWRVHMAQPIDQLRAVR